MFTEWLLGYAGMKVSDRLIKTLRGDPLMRELDSAVDEWRRTLPEAARLDAAAALFPSVTIESELTKRPALRALRAALSAGRVPMRDHWQDALIEQWQTVRKTVKDPQPFFTLGEDDARARLIELSVRLVDACAKQNDLFQPTALALLLHLEHRMEALSARTPLEMTAQALPVTSLAIEWTELMRRMVPAYGHAMTNNLPWPGEYSSLTDKEVHLHRLLKSAILAISPAHRDLIDAMDALRMNMRLDSTWDMQREALIDRITALESHQES